MHCKPRLGISHACSILYETVRGIKGTYNTDKPGLSCDMLRCPSKVTSVEAEGTVLGVTTSDTHSVHTLCTKLSAGRLTTELEFSLLAIVGALGTGCRTFVPGRTRNTCMNSSLISSEWNKNIYVLVYPKNSTHPCRIALRMGVV